MIIELKIGAHPVGKHRSAETNDKEPICMPSGMHPNN
jgi:hypothetical protein